MDKKLKSIIVLLLIIVMIIGIPTISECKNDGSLSASTSTSGDKITVTISSSKSLGAFTLKCSGAKPISAKSNAGGEANGSVVNGSSTSGVKKLGTFVFSVPNENTKVNFSVSGCEDTDLNAVSISSTSVTLKAKSSSNSENNSNSKSDTKDTSKSSNANLIGLTIKTKDYNIPVFSKDKTSYSVTVPNDVDSLEVKPKKADSKAKVKVTGNDNLEVGTNIINVVVTAEDGTTKIYKINVTKLATEDNKPGNVIDEENDLNLYLTSLSIDGLELSPAFDKNVFSYTTTIDMDTNDMSEVKVNAEANDSKATVEITGNTNLVEGENLINIVVKGTESSEQTVYQITVNKISQASEIASNNIFDKIKNIKREYLIIGGFIFIVVVIIIILIINHIRNRKYYNEMDEDGYYDNNEENENETSNFNERPQDNFIEELYKKRNNGEKLNKQDEETIEDIENENDRIFNKPKKGETVEYSEDTDKEDIEEEQKDEPDFLEERKEKRRKGKHF